MINNIENIESDFCSICLNEIKPSLSYTELTCGRTFHFQCILKEYSERKFCPNCHSSISSSPQTSNFGEDSILKTLDEQMMEDIEFHNEDRDNETNNQNSG